MAQVVGAVFNLVLLASGWIAFRSYCRRNDLITEILGASTLAWAWSVVGMQILGQLSLLNLPATAAWTGIGFALAAASRVLRAPKVDAATELDSDSASSIGWPAKLCLGMLVWVCLEMLFQSLLYPVKVMSDGPIYHLYFAARWWKAERYFLIPAPFGENAATYFPANGDLWFTWLMISWGDDRLAKVGQFPFLMLAGLAAYQIARSLGASRSSSIIATTWFLSSTALLVFSFQANVDTIFIANYLVSAYFFLKFARGDSHVFNLILGGLAAGGALGTKSVAVVFVPPLLLLACVAALYRSGSRSERWTRLSALLLSPLVLSGFWYFQNLLLTGNPVYPLQVEIWGYQILSGWYDTEAMQRSHFYIPRGLWTALGDTLLGVLDPRLAPLWLLSLVGVWAFPRSAQPNTARWIWLSSLMAAANVALFWLLIPYRTQQRFMLQALGLAVSPLAVTLDRSRWLRWIGSLLLCLHVLTPQTWPFVTDERQPIPWDLTPIIPNYLGPPLSLYTIFNRLSSVPGGWGLESLPSLAVTFGIGALSLLVVGLWTGKLGNRPIRRISISCLATFGLIVGSFFVYSPGSLSPKLLFYPPFMDFYRGWMAFDSLSGPRGTRVSYAGTNIPYYLFGTGLKNEVVYVNVDEHRDWLLHDYHRQARLRGRGNWPNPRPGWDRESPNYVAWLGNLEAEKIDLLVVTKVNTSEGAHNVADVNGFPIERQWAETHPDRFKTLYGKAEGDPWFRIYRLVRP